MNKIKFISNDKIYFGDISIVKDNVIKLLTPKSNTGWICNDFSIRQALEKINHYGYKAMPIVDGYGYYKGVISTDDILNYIREKQTGGKKDGKEVNS